jgi:uncharacterized repeat protein (TIGR01451 family)
MSLRRAVTLALLPFLIGPVFAQPQYPFPYPPGLPANVPPPLLYVRVLGPKGMKVTIYRPTAQTFEVPFTIGLRPGYTYRMQLSNIVDYPGLTLYPSLEVRGSLLLANRLRNPEFPAALVFRGEDFADIQAGAVITKAVVLERPDAAIPIPSHADEPLQIDVPVDRDPVQEAMLHGHILMMVRVGQLQIAPSELAAHHISGTVLLPGEKVLPLPRVLPWVPWNCYPVHDPILGPPDPAEHITIYDGGDVGLKAGVDRNGKTLGLDPTDTIAQYKDSHGRRHVAISNRVALCVPRFVVIRGQRVLAGEMALVGPGGTTVVRAGELIHARVPPLERHQNLQPGGLLGGQRLSGTSNTEGTLVVGRIAGLTIYSSLDGTRSLEGSQSPPECKEDRPLKIIKWPDKCGGLVGDTVTFHIRFSNAGDNPITDVVVSDSLANRFEYIPGSAKTDRESVFTVQPNENGSTILRWEFQGALQPGESGEVSFDVKIR